MENIEEFREIENKLLLKIDVQKSTISSLESENKRLKQEKKKLTFYGIFQSLISLAALLAAAHYYSN